MLKSASTSLLWRGILSVIIGVVSVAWPNVTVGAFVVLFAAYAFLAAILDFSRAFTGDRAGPVIGFILPALLSIAAGAGVLIWPGITAFVLAIWVAAWAFATGIMEVVTAFRSGQTAGDLAMWAIGGLVSLTLGVVLFIRPDIGAVSPASVFGLFGIVFGVSSVITSIRPRNVGQAAAQPT
ncbi:DUF308 domain-containing protein [Streptosporangium sp. NPDC051022]|uniref:HdeD family acid-resistance protein n=1 Tax=Streptosporangium sp. NPDC051022 TaxID=3155752 RepID=UPI0034249432